MADQNGILTTVTKAVSILYELGEDAEIGTVELSARLGIGKSTVSRLLKTLENEKLVYKDPSSSKYRLGTGMIELGTTALRNLNLPTDVLPILELLYKKIPLPVHFGVYTHGEALNLLRVPETSDMRLFSQVGSKVPVHATSMGRVLLAYQSESEIDSACKRLQVSLGRGFDKHSFKQQLSEIRASGYVVTRNEYMPGVAALAVPVHYGAERIVGAISVKGPVEKISTSHLNEYVRTMRTYSTLVSECANLETLWCLHGKQKSATQI